jgi:hypothetical protein
MDKDRLSLLLQEISDGFEQGHDLLLETDFLVQHEITADEHLALMKMVGASLAMMNTFLRISDRRAQLARGLQL